MAAAKRKGQRKQQPATPASPVPLLLIIAFYVGLVGYALHVFYWTPQPVPADAPPTDFSEGRARAHVRMLAEEIGLRSVSTPGLQQAHHYIWQFCQQLQAAAAAQPSSGLLVQAAFEHYNGSFAFDFVGERFMNAFHNITNIVLHISTKAGSASGQEVPPAVMLVAHHDSPVGSPGAGDDASNVGIMMELASNLVAGGADRFPASPVMFLFSGAEEPLCQSAAAFMSSSPWAARVGAFINLESVGPGGSPIVFQHAGAWTIQAFARGAPHPRGAIAAQDIFDAGLVLGDTDFRQLSYRHRGGLPGIDMAYLLSGSAYHTDRDVPDAIRPGVLQESGATLTAAVASLAAALAEAGQQGEQALQQLLQPADHKRLFLSVAGKFMLTYSTDTARLLHNLPLVLTLAAPATLKLLLPASALPVGDGLRVIAAHAGIGLLTLVVVLLLPAAQGAAFAWLSGKAMVWFAHQSVAFASYMPIAVGVLMWPWGCHDYCREPGAGRLLPYHMLGGAMLNGLLAAGLTQLNVGMAMIFALWGATGCAAAYAMALGPSLPALLVVLLAAAWPVYSCAETALVMSIVMMSRMSLTGHVFVGLGDTIVGVLLGLGTISLTGCSMLPVLQAAMSRAGIGKSSRKVAAALIVAGLAASAASSASRLFPYSQSMPKRLMLAHVHYTAPAAHHSDGSDAGGQGGVPMAVLNSSWVIASSDSNPSAWLAEAMGFAAADALPATGNEFGLIYPVSKLLDFQLFPAAPAKLPHALPHVRLLGRRSIPHNDSGDSGDSPDSRPQLVEAELEVFTAAPCWGTMRLSAPGGGLAAWSLHPGEWTDADSFAASLQGGSGRMFTRQDAAGLAGGSSSGQPGGQQGVASLVVKWTNEQQQGPLHWRLRVRYLQPAGEVQQGLGVELHVGYVQRTAVVAEMLARMPEWSTVSFEATTFISHWQF